MNYPITSDVAHEGLAVALFGFFGRTNLGNEATLSAFLHHLRGRFPGVRVACIAPRDSDVSETFDARLIDLEPFPVRRRLVRWGSMGRRIAPYAHLAIEPARAWRARDVLRHFQALIVPGTGILDDYAQSPFDLPQQLARWCVAAKTAGLPVYFLSVGAERVETPQCRALFRSAGAAAAYRSYRDAESRTHAVDLGLSSETDPVYPDLAFSLPTTALPVVPSRFAVRRVGIGVMGYYGWNKGRGEGEVIYQRYIGTMTRFVEWLVDRGYAIQLLIGDTAADKRPVRDILSRVPRQVAASISAEFPNDFHGLLNQIATTDLVVASRLHNVILSLLMERPSMSVDYSPKTRNLLREYSLGEFSSHIEDCDLETLIGQFQSLGARAEAHRALVRARNQSYRQLLDQQYQSVFSQLETALEHVSRRQTVALAE